MRFAPLSPSAPAYWYLYSFKITNSHPQPNCRFCKIKPALLKNSAIYLLPEVQFVQDLFILHLTYLSWVSKVGPRSLQGREPGCPHKGKYGRGLFIWVSDHGNTAGLSFFFSLSLDMYSVSKAKKKETVKQQVVPTKQRDWPKTCSSHTVNSS